MRNKSGTKQHNYIPKGWDPLAAWYDGWVGKLGSNHHQGLAIPAVMSLLDLNKKEKVLDVGCGQGVLAPHIVRQRCDYVGIDASPALIKIAKKRKVEDAEFIVGDANKLDSALRSHTQFDAAVFMLSIQDIKNLQTTISGTAKLLTPDGRLVILMKHPAFRIPRQTGWGNDAKRKLQFRRVDAYLSRLDIPLKKYPGQKSGVSISYHRPLQDYFNAIGDSGMAVTQVLEIPGTGVTKVKGRAEERAVAEIPLFIAIKAIKV